MKKYSSYLLKGLRNLIGWHFLYKRIAKIMVLSVGLLAVAGWTWNAGAQEPKPRMKIGAYYFAGWSGQSRFDDGTPENVWAKGMPTHYTRKLATEFAGRTPIWGWRDDTQEIMERQIDLAADNGLAYFSFCWYWADNKGPINVEKIEADSKHLPMRLFMQAKNNNRMEFSLLVANHGGFEIIGVDAWKQAADYWIKNYFKHPRYLRMDGKPVIVIFGTGGGNSEGFAYLQEAARKAGFPGVEIASNGRGKREVGYTLWANYGILPPRPKPGMHSYSEIIEASLLRWKGTPEQRYIPSVSVGWDNRPWSGPGGLSNSGVDNSYYFIEGKSPDAFARLLELTIQWMDMNPDEVTKDRLAVIYAWNEIGEGGWLVPCKDDPDGAYLKAIRNVVFGK
ncbi:MAG: glycoside hydrolase family 99-like domain-containing protein [Bacteroidetes bacterium]|nr:glycoside hydrolase family 99-like domain-containing protein [Bacteroidota bacterium]